MADRIITVTDPSVVTNDSLLGYNNYSDQDGQLGTTMTPTEATNGHTVTLSDGVVHEVTTKPVGTTNGEFSAVVSDPVTVDLTGSSFGFIPFETTASITETPTGTWTDAGSATTYDGRARNLAQDLVGQNFEMQMDVSTKRQAFLGLNVNTTDQAWNGGSSTGFGVLLRANSAVHKVVNGGNSATTVPLTLTWVAGEKVRIRVIGDQGTVQHVSADGLTVTDLETITINVAGALYPFLNVSNVAGENFASEVEYKIL